MGTQNHYGTRFLTADSESTCSKTLESALKKEFSYQKWPKIWSFFSEFCIFFRKSAGVFDAQRGFAFFFLKSYSPGHSASRPRFKTLNFLEQPVQNPGWSGQIWLFFIEKDMKLIGRALDQVKITQNRIKTKI